MPRPTKQPTPTPPTDTGDAALLPSDTRRVTRRPLGHRPPFLLVWAEDVFEVSSGKIVPRLMRYIVQNGVNGSGAITDRSGREIGVDPSLLRANLQAWNKHEIPHEVDGRGSSYMRQPYPGMYCDRWTTLHEGTERVTFDQAGYDEWRSSLVTRGHIPEPRRPALEALLGTLESSYDNAIKRLGSLPANIDTGATRELDDLRAKIKVIRDALASMADQSPGVAVPSIGTEATL
jgi:hypothetical protein